MTYSLVARNGSYLAAATASYSLGVGNAVPGLAPGVGAVISQAWTNRALRHHALDGLRSGLTAGEVLASLNEYDGGWSKRQVALLPAVGPGVAHTGDSCTGWAGSVSGGDFVVAGNLLTGPEVLEAMVSSLSGGFDPAPLAFAKSVLRALQAGEAAGGDSRGKQSACLLVCSNVADDSWPPDLMIDLRVDDSPEPLAELSRLLDLWREG